VISERLITAQCPILVVPELDVSRSYVVAVTVLRTEARSRANPAIAKSPGLATLPEEVTVWEAIVAAVAATVPVASVNVMLVLTPDSSYKVIEASADALAATLESNVGAASPPVATFVQMETRASAVAALPISIWFVHPEVPLCCATAAAEVVASTVTTATSRFPATRFCPVPKEPAGEMT